MVGIVSRSLLILGIIGMAGLASVRADDTASSFFGPEILIDNLEDTEHLDYPLVLIKGQVADLAEDLTIIHGERESYWPVVENRFKALVRLEPGANAVVLRAKGHLDRTLTLHYTPRETRYKVRMVYIVACDSDGVFQAPPGEPNDVDSAVDRLALGARLLQTATAELMYEAGAGRRTFQLVTDPNDRVDVAVVRTDLTTHQARRMAGLQLWRHFYLVDLPRAFPKDNGHTKNLAFMSMTWFDADRGRPVAHTALGADKLALYGTGGLHAWAQNLAELQNRLADERRPSDYGLLDDSARRNAFWANYATGLGACLHELGHAFGLPHSGNPYGIMERGFDRFNRLFALVENDHAFVYEHILWDTASAGRLADSPWFNAEPVGSILARNRHGSEVAAEVNESSTSR